MKYDFKCSECNKVWEEVLKVEDFRSIRKEGLDCECGSKAFNHFNPSEVEVCYVGFAWADKNFKEKEYRNNRSQYLGKKQKEVNYVPTLSPNFRGEKTTSWKEARDAARDAGAIDVTYDHLVKKEQTKK